MVSRPTPSFTDRVRHSLNWNAGSLLLTQLLGLVRSVTLARLLAPDDYGLFGMAATVLTALTSLTALGLDTSVVVRRFQSEAALHGALDSIWTAELLRRLGVTLLIGLALWPAVAFYQAPELLPLLGVAALTPLIQGFQNIGLVLLRKQLRFQTLALYEQAVALIATLGSIALAWWLRDAMALVWGQLVGVVAGVLLSYRVSPYRPRLAWQREALRPALHFGRSLFVVSVMTYITTSADNIALGRLLGSEALGVYVLAYGLASLPVSMIMGAMHGVIVPAYAELGGEGTARLGGAVQRVVVLGMALLIVTLLPLLLFADELVGLLYGAQWAGAVPLLRVLTLVGLLRGLANLLSALNIGVNRPHLEARAKSVEALLFLALLPPLIGAWGAVGAAWAGVIVYLLACAVRFWFAKGLLPEAMGALPLPLGALLGVAAIGGGSALLVVAPVHEPLWRLMVGSALAVGLTGAGLCWVNPLVRREATQLLAAARRRRAPDEKLMRDEA